jgi:hypothetical protein
MSDDELRNYEVHRVDPGAKPSQEARLARKAHLRGLV